MHFVKYTAKQFAFTAVATRRSIERNTGKRYLVSPSLPFSLLTNGVHPRGWHLAPKRRYESVLAVVAVGSDGGRVVHKRDEDNDNDDDDATRENSVSRLGE